MRALSQSEPEKTIWQQLPELGPVEVHCFLGDGLWLLECEVGGVLSSPIEAANMALSTRDHLRRMHGFDDDGELGRFFIRLVAEATGYERVLVYRFDAKGDGDVIAEYLAPDWEQSFLGFHFPASDIPEQVRALYLLSPERWLPHRDYMPVSLLPNRDPTTNRPFDLTYSQYRSISPIHQMYQRNLGVDASMALSIQHEGRLWGLLVGHSRRPHRVSSLVRSQVAALTEGYALRLATLHASTQMLDMQGYSEIRSLLYQKLAGADDFVSVMTEGDGNVSELFSGCSGVAVVHFDEFKEQRVRVLGTLPPEKDILNLMTWLRAHHEDVFATDCISSIYPAFAEHKDIASGVLVVFLGSARDQAILWFRPELVQSIVWGGRPDKVLDESGSLYLPRKSFERWVEQKFGHSQPWLDWERNLSRELGRTLNEVIIRQMRRIQDLDGEVQKLLWVISHDLREPLRAINVYTELLRRTHEQSLGSEAQEYIAFARKGALDMEKRLKGLIAYAEVDQMDRHLRSVDLSAIFTAVTKALSERIEAAGAVIELQDALPVVKGNERALRNLFDNIVSNALAFRDPSRPLVIRVWAEAVGEQWLIAVSDNGIGIASEHQQKVFGMFQRLNPASEASGIGLGLTLCQHIVKHLGGDIWLTSSPGAGTTVTFTLPREAGHGQPGSLSERTLLAPSVLREATREAHARIEATSLMAPLSSGRITLDAYRLALQALYGFYRPAEEWLFLGRESVATSMGIKPKLPALIKDMTALGLSESQIEALPLCQELPRTDEPAAQIGMLYVLEGSTLGGQVVRKRIAHALGIHAPMVTNFHGFHGDGAGVWWRQFQRELSMRLDVSSMALQQAVNTAQETFAALEVWLNARSGG